MKTMNGITNELLSKKAKRNWKSRCGAFLLAAIASLYGGQAVFGDVIITTSAGHALAAGVNFTQTPVAGVQPGKNAGAASGANPHTQYAWNGPNGDGTHNDLNYLAAGMMVNTIEAGVVTPNNAYLDNADSLTFTGGGGEATFYQSLSWTASAFSIESTATAQLYARGGLLNLGGRLSNAGTLNVQDNTAGVTISQNGITVSGGSNTGLINLTNTVMNLNGDLTGGTLGTINVGTRGLLNINTNNVGNNIEGNYTGGVNTRGLISITGNSNLNGNLIGSIALTDAGRAHITAVNTNLTKLTLMNNVVAQVDAQYNLGDTQIQMGSGGTLAKHRSVGNLTITNSINVGIVSTDGTNTAVGSTVGGISANVPGVVIPWNANADSLHDAGRRFTIAGTLSSSFLDSLVTINGDTEAYGTVVLTTGNTFTGSFDVLKGVLEVTDESCLGSRANDVNRYTVNLGGSYAGPTTERPTFRVVGNKGTSQTINHGIKLNADNATYEVFTAVDDGTGNWVADPTITTLADKDRFTVMQAGLISGSHDLNKAGDGVLVLTSGNSYTGDTVIWHGVLRTDSAENINNAANARILIGGITGYDQSNFRPVFETALGKWDTNTVVINASVMINQINSVIRTTGLGNETIINNTVGTEFIHGYEDTYAQYDAVLNKEGAGTLTLHGTGSWGAYGAGELQIKQGTVQFKSPNNLSKGYITIGADWNAPQYITVNGVNVANPAYFKDREVVDRYGNPVVYKATLKLEDNCGDVAIGNQIILNSPKPSTNDDPSSGSYIEVGQGSKLTLTSVVRETATAAGSNLNKAGAGELVLSAADNSFTGWTNIYSGTLTTTSLNNLSKSLGVDLVGNNTTFALLGADQTINNLRGSNSTDPNAALPANWTRTVNIGNQKLTVNTQLADTVVNKTTTPSNLLYGNIVSGENGMLVKSGLINSTLAAGFVGFQGGFEINAGDIRTLTDTTVTSLTGKAGTHVDLNGNKLTVNVGTNNQFNGTIVNTAPTVGKVGTLVKSGAGTLITNFTETSSGRAFNGSVDLQEGSIKSNSDFTMAEGGTLSFHVQSDAAGTVTPLVFDISGHKANFSAVTNLNVVVDNPTTGWSTPSGRTILGEVDGNDTSNYDGLKTTQTNSLFITYDKEIRTSAGRKDLLVVANVNGFEGLGNTYNEIQVGTNLDNIRTQNLTGNPTLATIFQNMWALGSNVTTAEQRLAAEGTLRNIYDEMSGDLIANATFIGLDSPWKRPFDRLNLDSQMVYVYPQQPRQQYRPAPQPQPQYRGQVPMVANMRNVWFTPTYQGVNVRSDGNARGFNIERGGYQLGWDKRVAPNASVGLMLGYSSPSLHQGNNIVDASDFQVGVYGGAMVGYFIELKGYIGFGHQNYKSNRTVDLSGIGMPSQSAHGTFDGDTFNFSLEVARPLFLGFSVLRPIIGLDSEHAFRYSFAENGDAIALRYGRSSISRTRARFALDLETCTLQRMIWHGRLGYSALLGGNDYADTTAQFINVYAPDQNIRSVAVGTSYFEAGVGFKYFLNPAKTLMLVADYDASVANRWAEHRGVVGFTYIY